jgi:hypothetical protein
MYRCALGELADPIAAADVLSEVLLEVWEQAGRVAGRVAAGPWLLALARGCASARRRRGGRLRVAVPAACRAQADPGELPLRRALRRIERDGERGRRVRPLWRAVAVAAGAAVLVQAGVLLRQTFGPPPTRRPAPPRGASEPGTVSAPGPTDGDTRALLDGAGATIVGGPGSGAYRIELPGAPHGDRARRADDLTASGRAGARRAAAEEAAPRPARAASVSD